ncbi:MAG: hypothetical protein MJ053_07465, partial [Elusimicrobiaceae bacterium]|nr:hypothetical protein [Elusimicrobiaceae bacterium]
MKFTNNQSAQAAAQAIDMRGEFLSQREVSRNAGELRALLIDMGLQVAPTKEAAPRTDSEFKTNGARKATAAEPLRNHEDFQRLATYLRNKGRYGRRNYMLLVLGVTLGLRCGDLLRLRVGDVYSCDTKRVRAAVTLIEEKTNKRTRNVITPAAAAAIADYIAGAKEVR